MMALDPNCHTFLQRHNGKVLKIDITDLHLTLFFIIKEHTLFVFSNYTDFVNTSICGSSFSLLQQLFPNSQTHLLIQGDADLAHDTQLLIQNWHVDWEECFSYLTGDFAATRIINFMRNLKNNLTHVKTRTIEDVVDYVQEEKRFLPTREEIEDFYEEVASLRYTVERLEARLSRLTEMAKK